MDSTEHGGIDVAPCTGAGSANGTRDASPGSTTAASSAGPAPEPAGGRVALVSGGNRGLGLQIVRALAGQGMRVVLGSRSVERGRVAVDLLDQFADRVAVRQLDITDTASVERLVSWMDGRLGRCDVLVNNAAVLLDEDRDAGGVPMDVVRGTLETNLLGTWRLTQAVGSLMRRRRYGRVVNISSAPHGPASAGRGVAAYRVSKGAVNALTRMLADELAGEGILVNACCPEPVGVVSGDVEDGARLSASPDTAVWLATLPVGGPTGRFFCRRAAVEH